MGTAVFWKHCKSSVSAAGLRQRSTSTAGRGVKVLPEKLVTTCQVTPCHDLENEDKLNIYCIK
jgi:hypothetical protein